MISNTQTSSITNHLRKYAKRKTTNVLTCILIMHELFAYSHDAIICKSSMRVSGGGVGDRGGGGGSSWQSPAPPAPASCGRSCLQRVHLIILWLTHVLHLLSVLSFSTYFFVYAFLLFYCLSVLLSFCMSVKNKTEHSNTKRGHARGRSRIRADKMCFQMASTIAFVLAHVVRKPCAASFCFAHLFLQRLSL